MKKAAAFFIPNLPPAAFFLRRHNNIIALPECVGGVFLERIEYFIGWAAEFVWGPALLLLVLLGGAFFTVASGLYPIRKLKFIAKSTFGSVHNKSGGFAAMATALGATAGTGNIVGVASAIAVGGAGAVFWMWVGAFLGMMLKFAEAALAVKYRGGAMKYIEHAFGGRFAAIFWSICCVLASFGTGNMVQTNAAGSICKSAFGASPLIIGSAIAVLSAAVLFRGAKAVTKVSSFLVPFMAAFYMLGCAALIFICRDNLPATIKNIFSCAFSTGALSGGAVGIITSKALQSGISRGTFTNEAGMGSASIAHAESSGTPAEQGCWGIVEVFLDTVVCCTLTALAILSSGIGSIDDCAAEAAFSKYFGGLGSAFLALSMFFFALAAVIGWAFYGERALCYITNSKKALLFYRMFFCLCAAAGSALSLPAVWNLSDIFNGLMIFPNTAALLVLKKEILNITKT